MSASSSQLASSEIEQKSGESVRPDPLAGPQTDPQKESERKDESALVNLAREIEKEILDSKKIQKLNGATKEGIPCDQAALDADFRDLVDTQVKAELADRLEEIEDFFDGDGKDQALGSIDVAIKVRGFEKRTVNTLIYKMLFDGKRVPQIASKLCLTNKEVYKIISDPRFESEYISWQDKLETHVKQNIQKKFISAGPEAATRQISLMRSTRNEKMLLDVTNSILERASPKKKEEVAAIGKLLVIGLDQTKIDQMLGINSAPLAIDVSPKESESQDEPKQIEMVIHDRDNSDSSTEDLSNGQD